jgi:hypothetical protein
MLVSSHKIQTVLSRLAKKRPVFHSEADFQHALAWELQLESPDAQIRLEKQVATHGSRVYLDLLFQSGDVEIAIEIKYKTRHGKFLYSGEEFALRNQSAQDIGRHDFIKDIQRLERYLQSHNNAVGFAVFLTNDQSYWNESKKSDAVDTEFRIHEGRVLHGCATWGAKASAGTKHKREEPITLHGKYTMKWSNYSSLGNEANEQFRYVLLSVPGDA